MYKFTQGRGALELYSVFFAACHAKHVNLHFPIIILSESHFCNIYLFHIRAASMSVLEKLLQEIGRLTNFSPDQVSTITFSGFTSLVIIYGSKQLGHQRNVSLNHLAVSCFISVSELLIYPQVQ